jgi:hypothetical protein
MSAVAKLWDPPADNIPSAIPVGILVSYTVAKSRTRKRVRKHHTVTAPVQDPAAVWSDLEDTSSKSMPQRRRRPERSNGLALVAATLCGSLLTASLFAGGWLAVQRKAAAAPAVLAVQAGKPSAPAAFVPAIKEQRTEPVVEPPPARAVVPHVAAPEPMTEKQEPTTIVAKEEPKAAAPVVEACSSGQCAVRNGRYGTSVNFVSNPIEAGKQAMKEKKLLFILNISGNFEDDKFT